MGILDQIPSARILFQQPVQALAWYAGRVEPVVVHVLDMLHKAGTPPGSRWITVKPPGHEKGTPVLVQEPKTGSGVYHVIGGAGGSLNYLKLKGVKSAGQYAQEAGERHAAKKVATQQQKKRDKELGVHAAKQAERSDIATQEREHAASFVKEVAEAMGWTGHQYDPTPHLNLSKTAQHRAYQQHHSVWLKKAHAAVDANRRALLDDAEARTAVLNGLPLVTDDAALLAVQDLDRVKPVSGLGYATEYKKRAEARGATDADIKAEARADKPPPEAAADKRQAAAQRIAKEMESVRDPDLQRAEIKIVAARQAVALLQAEKRLKVVKKKASAARKEIDAAAEPKAYVLEVSDQDVDGTIAEDLANDLRTLKTRAFLSEVGKVEDYENTLGRHIGVGAYNALNSVALTVAGAGLVERDVVDVLGIAGAAQVLAQRLKADFTSDEISDLRHGLETYHKQHYMQASDDAMKRAKSAYDLAESIQMDAATHGDDLTVMRELNAKRSDALNEANRLLGTTLGEMETNAALLMALGGKGDPVEVSMGKVSNEDAIRRARAIGLDRGDYQIHAVGANRFMTVTTGGMQKLSKPVNRADLAQLRGSQAIIDGQHDEDNWLPQGVANRPDLAMRADSGAAARLAEPFAAGEDLHRSISDYIGGRTADGDTPADIVGDLLSQDVVDKVGERKDDYFAALNTLAPMRDANGGMLRAETHQDAFEQLADAYVDKRHGSKRLPLHRQKVTVDQVSVDALHRALAAEPAGVLAYRPVGELHAKDQHALRNWWAREIGSRDEKATALRVELDTLSKEEPEKEVDDMFGRGANPAWTDWKQRRDGKAEELNNTGLNWPKYVQTMGSPANAYTAVQDLVRSRVAKHFHEAHNTLRPDAPIALGRTVIRGNLDHLDAVDPQARTKRLEEHRELVDSLRERNAGRYASGSVSDKMDARREAQHASEQSQIGFFATTPEPEKAAPLRSDERHTLGHAAEQQVAQMLGVVGQNFRPDQPTKLWNPSMNGKYINQQRATKLLEHNKRLVLAQGTGSGKTLIGLSGFSHLHAQGKVKRGIYIVPSIVQGQFSGEALRYLEPGKFKWDINPGASREQRLAAYRDPETHFSAVTHQSFRDDMVHLGAQQAGMDEAVMAEKINSMKPAERKTWVKGVMDAHGMDHDYLFVDEGHDLLNRAGKQNSLLANVVDAVSHNVPYYVNASADPVKNDPSEAFDLLHKMDPDRYTDRSAFLRKYGVDTAVSRDALRREVSRYFYPGRIDSGGKVARTEQQVPLTQEQHTAMSDMDKHLSRARLARMKNGVDVEAMRALSPSSFDGVDAAHHETVARQLQKSLGIIKESATSRIINAHPASAKLDSVDAVARARPGKPGVVFAHNIETVKNIAARLTAAGHRVVVLTGADSATEKDRKKLAFNPETGEASADIIVASDAGSVGANLQRGRWLVNYDTPNTAKVHAQRNGRIDRLGQKGDIELIDLVADHPSERKARQRLRDKYALREVLTSPLDGQDDTGLAGFLHQAKTQREQTNGSIF